MSDVQFNEEQPVVVSRPEKHSILTKMALATGMVTTPRGAQFLLLIVGVLALGLAVFFFLASGSELPETNPSDYAVWPS